MNSAALLFLSSLMFTSAQVAIPAQVSAAGADVALGAGKDVKEGGNAKLEAAKKSANSTLSATLAAPDDALSVLVVDKDEILIREVLAKAKTAAARGDVAGFDATLSQSHRALLDELMALTQDSESTKTLYQRASVLQAFAARKAVLQNVSIAKDSAHVSIQTLGVIETLPMVFENGSWKLAASNALILERNRLLERKKEAEAIVHKKDATALDKGHDHAHNGKDEVSASSQPAKLTPLPVGVHLKKPWWYEVFNGDSAWHYMLYAPDYAFILATGSVYISGIYGATDSFPALIGPDLSAQRPAQNNLNDYRLDGVIGKPFLQEKIPVLTLGVVGVGALGLAGVVDGLKNQDFHQTHAFTVGALTALSATLTAVELSKIAFGRLRPDYRDRYNRAACSGTVDDNAVDCQTAFGGGPFDGFGVNEYELRDGRKSFVSGHAASSFAFATYLSLYLGGEYIWGEDANGISMPVATGIIGLAYGAAAFTSASRLSDNKHHFEDVAVGAVLGTAVSAASYFIHFDLKGNARYRAARVSPMVTDGGGGVQVSGRF